MNPENKCAHLLSKFRERYPLSFEEMFAHQKMFQSYLHEKGRAIDPDSDFKTRIDDISKQWRNLCTEFGELLERLPYKEWKTYSEDQLRGFSNQEHELECKFEVADMFIFLMNIALDVGMTGGELRKIVSVKMLENIERQKNGY